jgi:hypothetical protein
MKSGNLSAASRSRSTPAQSSTTELSKHPRILAVFWSSGIGSLELRKYVVQWLSNERQTSGVILPFNKTGARDIVGWDTDASFSVIVVCGYRGRESGRSSEESEYVRVLAWVGRAFILVGGGREDVGGTGGDGGRCCIRLDWRVARVSRSLYKVGEGGQEGGGQGSRGRTRGGTRGSRVVETRTEERASRVRYSKKKWKPVVLERQETLNRSRQNKNQLYLVDTENGTK